jgi:lipopolysaccharide export system protein LptA
MGGVMAVFTKLIKKVGFDTRFIVVTFLSSLIIAGLLSCQVFSAEAAAAEETKAELKTGDVKKADADPVKPAKTPKAKAGKSPLMGGGDKEPTVITANSLTADNKAKTALFTGNVVAKKGDGTLYADRMLVFYVETGDGENSNIDRIEASGNVKLVRNNRIITSGKAIYYAGEQERAVFSDKPRATENRNVVTGTLMTYYIKDDRSVVENSKIFIVEKEGSVMDRKPADSKSSDKKKKKN